MKLHHLILDKVTRGIFGCVALFPLTWSRKMGRLIGQMHYRFNTRAANTTRQNLTLCFPDWSVDQIETMTLSSLIHTAQTLMEIPGVWLGDLEHLKKRIVRVENEALLHSAIAKGHGVVVLLPHTGNWEMLNAYFAAANITMHALYKPPEQTWLQPMMREIREHFGNHLVPTDARGIATLFKQLRKNAVTVVLPDQVPRNGEFAPFFNQLAYTDRLVNRLLTKTGATAVCATLRRVNEGFVVMFSEVDDNIYSSDIVESLTAMNKSIENSLTDCIEQYQWEYKRFKERPPGSEQVYK